MLDELLAKIKGFDATELADVTKTVMQDTGTLKWVPSPGPQTDAYFCEADLLLFGGSAGGGKSDLGLGLALSQHRRSLIIRRTYSTLCALTERILEINGSRDGFSGSAPPLLRTADGRYVQFAGNQHIGDEQAWQGHPFDLKFFDEGAQLLESQVRFHLGWLRSTVAGQRVRAVIATNPPLKSDGDWLIRMFRPWLDLTYDRPARMGELRWFVTDPDGKDLEVAGPEPVKLPGADDPLLPKSRTFIEAKLSDNPYLTAKYKAELDALPEPIRSAVRDGNFMATRQDVEFQLIPTSWVIAAQSRWTPEVPRGMAMTALACDPAGGGMDNEAIAYRYGGWYAPLQSRTGIETRDGASAAALIITFRRDGCPVIVDVGGGFAGAMMLRLRDNGMDCARFDGGGKTAATANDGSGMHFANKRAEAWWRFREALDPGQEGGSIIALPPDPELRSDLTSPTWELTPRGILLESKDDIRKRIGRSPGKGDAVVMALAEGDKARMRSSRINMRDMPTTANRGFEHVKRMYSR